MKNLNKFTKAELINKFKKLENLNSNNNNNSIQSNLKWIDILLLLKSLIIKITLITFLIKWIKKYSLVRKFYLIFNAIASTLLSLSIIDIYSWDVIYWIKDTSIYKWFSDLISTPKKDLNIESKASKDEFNIFESTSIETNGIQTNDQTDFRKINKINRADYKEEIINNENHEIISENSKVNYKGVIIISTIIISSLLYWYYFNEIKEGYNSIIDWIKSIKPDDGSNNQGDNPPIYSSRERLEKVVKDRIRDIESQPIASSSNINFENLESSSSPTSSTSSTQTITPFNKDNSSNLFKEKLTDAMFWNENWMKILDNSTKEKIQFIDRTLKSSDKLNENNELITKIIEIISYHNDKCKLFSVGKEISSDINEVNAAKELTFQLRKWIIETHEKVLPNSNVKIDLGLNTDSPKILPKEIFD